MVSVQCFWMGWEVVHNFLVISLCLLFASSRVLGASDVVLRFNDQGNFKILQIADMHYGNGETTECQDIPSSQLSGCSDLNTTAFVRRLIREEEPDLIVFTGDNIEWAATDARRSMDAAFAPAIEAKIPWAAILGNHDVESNMNRPQLMEYISQMEYSLAKVLNPHVEGIYGWGNYYLSVLGPSGTEKENLVLLNLYFLDSGDNSKLRGVRGYDWIRKSQQIWFSDLSKQLRAATSNQSPVPALAYFHIPLPEYDTLIYRDHITGQQLEEVYSSPVNSGFFSTLLEAGDVKATFVGHDHINDYCGRLMGIQLCYGGGTGYHGYGRVGWPRRARIVVATLDRDNEGHFLDTPNISTWKRLDDSDFTKKDMQLLYSHASDVPSQLRTFAYRKDCCWPWIPFLYPQGKCFFWSSIIYTGAVLLLSTLVFSCGFLCHRYRFSSTMAYAPVSAVKPKD